MSVMLVCEVGAQGVSCGEEGYVEGPLGGGLGVEEVRGVGGHRCTLVHRHVFLLLCLYVLGRQLVLGRRA